MTVKELRDELTRVEDDAVVCIEANNIFKEATFVMRVRSPRWVDGRGDTQHDGIVFTLQHLLAQDRSSR